MSANTNSQSLEKLYTSILGINDLNCLYNTILDNPLADFDESKSSLLIFMNYFMKPLKLTFEELWKLLKLFMCINANFSRNIAEKDFLYINCFNDLLKKFICQMDNLCFKPEDKFPDSNMFVIFDLLFNVRNIRNFISNFDITMQDNANKLLSTFLEKIESKITDNKILLKIYEKFIGKLLKKNNKNDEIKNEQKTLNTCNKKLLQILKDVQANKEEERKENTCNKPEALENKIYNSLNKGYIPNNKVQYRKPPQKKEQNNTNPANPEQKCNTFKAKAQAAAQYYTANSTYANTFAYYNYNNYTPTFYNNNYAHKKVSFYFIQKAKESYSLKTQYNQFTSRQGIFNSNLERFLDFNEMNNIIKQSTGNNQILKIGSYLHNTVRYDQTSPVLDICILGTQKSEITIKKYSEIYNILKAMKNYNFSTEINDAMQIRDCKKNGIFPLVMTKKNTNNSNNFPIKNIRLNLMAYNKLYLFTSNLVHKIFKECKIIKRFYIIFTDILLYRFPIFKSGYELCLIIINFLELNYNIFDFTGNEKRFNTVNCIYYDFDNIQLRNNRKLEDISLMMQYKNKYFPEFHKEKLGKINSLSLLEISKKFIEFVNEYLEFIVMRFNNDNNLYNSKFATGDFINEKFIFNREPVDESIIYDMQVCTADFQENWNKLRCLEIVE